ncbi:MAG: hypothetical protein ACRDTE_15180 [Pseudonocardiaceae bacterium]
MPQIATALPVRGTVTTDAAGPLIVLANRLDGYDTFLTGQLELAGRSAIGVRIFTFDDVTVLRPRDESVSLPAGECAGVLHLSHGWRNQRVPADLVAAAAAAHRDLARLTDAEQRYALTFLGEATTDAIRQGRIDIIVSALPAIEEDNR